MQLRSRRSSTVARPVTTKSAKNSQRPVELPVQFTCHAPQAETVTVAGTFNNWDATRTPLTRDAQGAWTTTVWLPSGRYEYRFLVDGQWIDDPSAKESVQNTFGSTNAVLTV